MTTDLGRDLSGLRPWSWVDAAFYLAGVVGLTGALTMLFLGMRAVMDIGGYCAEGGPYVIDTRCPEGVALLFPLSIFAGLGSAALMGWKGSRLGGYWGAMVMLAWPALFISLGFNFLQYALVPPPPATGIVWGWLIPGVLFELMGGLPLLAFLPSGRSRRKGRGFGPRVRDAAAEGEARYANQLPRARARLLNGLAAHAEDRAVSTTSRQVAPPTRAEEPDLVSQLERLAALHRSGSLTYDEFQRAKAALLGHSA